MSENTTYTYALDIAFDASATAENSSDPIAATFGWAKSTNGGATWQGIGQRPNHKAPSLVGGSVLYISFFDMSNTAEALENVRIQSAKGEDYEHGQPKHPWLSMPPIPNPLDLEPGLASAGCNVTGNGALPFAPSGLQLTDKRGDWELTFEFKAEIPADGGTTTTKKFRVDPEMSVGPTG